MLKLDLSQLAGFLPQGYAVSRQTGLKKAADMLAAGNGPGGDFTGWVALPEQYDREEFARIQAAAERIKRQSQVLVVVGIGGSYLGARAVIELLSSPNYNLKQKNTPDIYFAGNGLSTDALLERQQPGEDGAYHLPLATYYVHHLSLDPRKNFARFLYLAERMTEALEYQYDKMGYFYSNP